MKRYSGFVLIFRPLLPGICTEEKSGHYGDQGNHAAAGEEPPGCRAEAMPADKFSFPTPLQMTFGHLVAHMIDSNYYLCAKRQ
jgi:hypothetical protein